MATKKIIRYRGGHIRPMPFGTFDTYISHGGKQYRKRFKNVNAARAWLETFDPQFESLTQRQTLDAMHALDILPEGVSLTEAARCYVNHNKPAVDDTYDLLTHATAFIADRSQTLRKSTINTYRRFLNLACNTFSRLSDMTTDAIRQWLAPMTPHNRNHAIKTLSALFAWLIEYGHANENPAAKIKLTKLDAPKRQVLSIDDVNRLLQTALTHDPRLIPYLAICLFAGVRPDECKRLSRQNCANDYIRLDESITKTHSARTIPIHPNLAAILAKYPIPREGVMHGLSTDRFRKNVTAITKLANVNWANDIMRHSYASYEYERSRDAAATAANMGHTGTDLFFKHYRGLVEPGTGVQYFSIVL